MSDNGAGIDIDATAVNIDVRCIDGTPTADPKTAEVPEGKGAIVINWHADNSVYKILGIAFKDGNQTEFIEIKPLNDKHWQCKDKRTQPSTTWEYMMIVICNEGDDPKLVDPFIHNQP